MATITNWDIVQEIIDHHGYDPPMYVVKIVQYTNREGSPNNWGIIYDVEVPLGLGNRYEQATEYIRNWRVIWTVEKGLLCP
jgi:hypothetical protein